MQQVTYRRWKRGKIFNALLTSGFADECANTEETLQLKFDLQYHWDKKINADKIAESYEIIEISLQVFRQTF